MLGLQTLPQLLHPTATTLVWSTDDIETGNLVWPSAFELVQGSQRVYAKPVCAAEQDSERVMLWASPYRPGCEAASRFNFIQQPQRSDTASEHYTNAIR